MDDPRLGAGPNGNTLYPLLLRCLASFARCGIATLTQRPIDNQQFPFRDVADWPKAAVC